MKRLSDGKIRLEDVRLSFPHLWKPVSFQEGQNEKYSATFIMDRRNNRAEIKELEKEIKRLINEKFKGKRLQSDKICLRDGEEKDELDGYGEDVMFINASARKSSRPHILDENRNPLTEDDGVLYSGCRVNAIITLWAQDNKYGKRVNANLLGVQFLDDDEPLASDSGRYEEDDFEELDDDYYDD